MNTEAAEKLAQELLKASQALGHAINEIEIMARLGAQQIRDESNAYETAVLTGTDVIHALKTLAMRFDRAALIKFEG